MNRLRVHSGTIFLCVTATKKMMVLSVAGSEGIWDFVMHDTDFGSQVDV